MQTYGEKHKRTLYGVVVGILIAAFLLFLAISASSCVPTEQQMLNLSNDVATLNASIDEQQSKLMTQIDKVQDHVTIVNDAVKAAKTLPDKAAAGIEASRPFNPYADEMAAGLGLLTVVGGLFLRKKTQEGKEKDAAIARVKIAAKPDSEKEVYEALNAGA